MPRSMLVAAVVLFSFTATLRAAEPKKPAAAAVALQPFATLPLPESVQVTHPQPIVAVPLSELTVDPLPDFLVGATALTRQAGKYPVDVAAGKIEVEATADGPLFLAVCTRPDGNKPGNWKAEIWPEKKFLDGNWLLVAEMKLLNSTSPTPEPHSIWVRQGTAGEKFAVRTRLTHPPIVLVADPKLVKNAYDFEPHTSLAEFRQSATITRKMNLLLGGRQFDVLDPWIMKYIDDDPTFPSGRYKIKATNKLYTHASSTVETQKAARKFVDDAEAWLAAKPDSLAAQFVLGRLLVDYARIVAPRNNDEKGRVDELMRRGFELVYGVGQARPKLTDVYRTHGMQMIGEKWEVNFAKDMILKAIDSGAWCPQVVGEGLMHINNSLPRGADRTQVVRAVFDEFVARSPEKYRAAMPAACFKDLPAFAFALPSYGITWPEVRAGFEALDKLFPNSAINDELAAKFAFRAGDREFTVRMFERLAGVGLAPEAPPPNTIWRTGELDVCRAWVAADYAAGDQRRLLEYYQLRLLHTQWLPDGKIFLCDETTQVGTLDPDAGVMTSHGRWAEYSPREIRVAVDGKSVAFCTAYGYALVREYPTGKPLLYAELPNGSPTNKDAYPDGNCMAAAPDLRRMAVHDRNFGDLVQYDAQAEKVRMQREPELRRKQAFTQPAVLLSYRNQGRELVSFDGDGVVQLWNSDDLTPLKQWQANTGQYRAYAAISRDGNRLATFGSDKFVRVWSLPEGEKLAEFKTANSAMYALAFSPDGRRLAGADGNHTVKPCAIHVWDVDAGRLIRDLHGHKAGLISLDFSPDGKTLLSASVDLSLRLWDVPTE